MPKNRTPWKRDFSVKHSFIPWRYGCLEIVYAWTEATRGKGHAIWWSWASYQIRKIADCSCTGNAGNVSLHRRFQRKPLVSDAGMHHGTCVTHVPWCMSGSLTSGENVPGIPGACAPAVLRIWQEAHCWGYYSRTISSLSSHCNSVNQRVPVYEIYGLVWA